MLKLNDTFTTASLDSATSLEDIAKAIMTPEHYASYKSECDRFFADESAMKIANFAINHAVCIHKEECAFDPANSLDYFVNALALAKHFQRVLPEGTPFKMNTDEPCMIWGSPWDIEVDSPEEYAFVMAVFSLQNGEAAFSQKPNEFDGELIEPAIVDFATRVQQHLPPAEFRSLAETYLIERDYESGDGEGHVLNCVQPLLAAA